MRILTINNSADIYGASRCLQRVFTEVVCRGHKVFAVLPAEGPLAADLRDAGVHVLIHPTLSVIDRQGMRSVRGLAAFLLGFPFSVLRLARWIRQHRIDVVHTNTAVMPGPALAALLTRRPHLWHTREFFAEFGPLWRVYQRYLCALSHSVLAISDAVRSQFAAAQQSRIRVIYDGLPSGFANTPDLPQGGSLQARFGFAETCLIGVVGRIKWVRKGQEILVQAFAAVQSRFPEARLVIIGSVSPGNEPHLLRLQELAHTLGVANRITFTGDLEASAALYQALTVTVVPSVQPEPFGCVVQESMAAGTPVIGSDAAGIAEQIVHGDSGLLFPPGDAEALAARLAEVLGDPALRARLAAGGRQRVATHFQLQSTVDAMLDTFEAALHPAALLPLQRPSPTTLP